MWLISISVEASSRVHSLSLKVKVRAQRTSFEQWDLLWRFFEVRWLEVILICRKLLDRFDHVDLDSLRKLWLDFPSWFSLICCLNPDLWLRRSIGLSIWAHILEWAVIGIDWADRSCRWRHCLMLVVYQEWSCCGLDRLWTQLLGWFKGRHRQHIFTFLAD